MLRELHIANLAVIAEAHIELAGGLNCITGETGAGKSLVLGAINVLLGLKGASDLLRRGAQEGHVTGVFEIADAAALDRIRAVVDLPLDGEEGIHGEILLTRRLLAGGRTRVSLNGEPITLAQLRQLGDLLVDIHGQHDNAYLLKPASQLDVLDHFAGLLGEREAYRTTWTDLQQARRRLADLLQDRVLREQALELFRFQADEIDRTELDPADFERVRQRAAMLGSLERLKADTARAYSELQDSEGAIVDHLKRLTRLLDELGRIDGQLLPIAEAVRGGMIQIEEAARDLSRYMDRLDLDPAELEEANERLTVVQKILHKYGGTMESALAYRQEIAGKIATLSGQEVDLGELRAKIDPLGKRLLEQGMALRSRRLAAAREFGPIIEAQLSQLGMEKARFTIEVTPLEGSTDRLNERLSTATAMGLDHVEFIAQTNPGLDPLPLRRIASGGELSRVMLALKHVLKRDDRVSVLVFDEIDANVGGRLAAIVGQKLRELATRQQVLCITHLPQIASYADRHLTVRKLQRGGETRTTIHLMSGEERLEELAAMIGGKSVSATTRAQARELLEVAAADVAKSDSAVKRQRRRRAS